MVDKTKLILELYEVTNRVQKLETAFHYIYIYKTCMSIKISIHLACSLIMMSVSTSSTVRSPTSHLVFCYQESIRRQQKSRTISCTASNEFRKEMTALNSKRADVDQLKKAYRKLALRYHPDVCDPSMREESTRMFIELQKTYVNLLDQESQKTVSSETRDKWESQISELKRRSQGRQEQRDGSWGSRMRAKQHGP